MSEVKNTVKSSLKITLGIFSTPFSYIDTGKTFFLNVKTFEIMWNVDFHEELVTYLKLFIFFYWEAMV